MLCMLCSYNCVEEVDDEMTDWEAIVTMFPEGQRSRSKVKERWGELKKRLVYRKQFKYKSKFREWYKTALVSYKNIGEISCNLSIIFRRAKVPRL